MTAEPTPTPFWLVWTPGGVRPPSFRHPTLQSATREADRLASENPGYKVYVVAPVSSTVACQHEREAFYNTDDQVPF